MESSLVYPSILHSYSPLTSKAPAVEVFVKSVENEPFLLFHFHPNINKPKCQKLGIENTAEREYTKTKHYGQSH